jgi:hypothetical protein
MRDKSPEEISRGRSNAGPGRQFTNSGLQIVRRGHKKPRKSGTDMVRQHGRKAATGNLAKVCPVRRGESNGVEALGQPGEETKKVRLVSDGQINPAEGICEVRRPCRPRDEEQQSHRLDKRLVTCGLHKGTFGCLSAECRNRCSRLTARQRIDDRSPLAGLRQNSKMNMPHWRSLP